MNITNLPKWAQKHIEDIQRQRDVAVQELNYYVDNQTPSQVWYDDYECTEPGPPVMRRKYIQTNRITIGHVGVELDVLCRENHIDIGWGIENTIGLSDVIFQPSSFQRARLFLPKAVDMWSALHKLNRQPEPDTAA